MDYQKDYVYIFENAEAERIKVGFSGWNVGGRLDDINDIWTGRKVTCQICGGRLVNVGGRVPKHVVTGKKCIGGKSLPLEKDSALAEAHLKIMKNHLEKYSGNDKASFTRRINTLEKRIEIYRNYGKTVGEWRFVVAYLTKEGKRVEKLSHEFLAGQLDGAAPIGEVFNCTAVEATEAVEKALDHLGLLQSMEKREHL